MDHMALATTLSTKNIPYEYKKEDGIQNSDEHSDCTQKIFKLLLGKVSYPIYVFKGDEG
jgi:hypothetical protein